MSVTPSMKEELRQKLEGYLSGSLSHAEINEFAWGVTDDVPKEPAEDEKVYWSTVFSIIHLADDEHWNDGCTQRDLGSLCEQLKNE